jgi:hypothetical protein
VNGAQNLLPASLEFLFIKSNMTHPHSLCARTEEIIHCYVSKTWLIFLNDNLKTGYLKQMLDFLKAMVYLAIYNIAQLMFDKKNGYSNHTFET